MRSVYFFIVDSDRISFGLGHIVVIFRSEVGSGRRINGI